MSPMGGAGGGTIVTPLLAAAGGLPQPAVLGTALLAMLPPSAVALAGHARLGNVDWRLAAGERLSSMYHGCD